MLLPLGPRWRVPLPGDPELTKAPTVTIGAHPVSVPACTASSARRSICPRTRARRGWREIAEHEANEGTLAATEDAYAAPNRATRSVAALNGSQPVAIPARAALR
nr:hypothetical protein GCM10017611_12620 [Rhodococcus wratislaviensis]